MDIARPRRRSVSHRLVLGATLGLAAAMAAWSLPELLAHRGEGPAVSRATLVVDTVVFGPLENSLLAAGVLVPDRVHVVASVADGVVRDVFVRPGSIVSASTPIVRLENPDLNVAAVDASAQLSAARADLEAARQEAAVELLDARSALRTARAESARATAQAASDEALHVKGYIADLPYRSAMITSEEDRDLVAIADRKVGVGAADAAAKVASARARVAQLSAETAARGAQVETLTVLAGADGMVQSIAVDPGQRITSGTEFARIADQHDLKVVLQVAENDVRGVAPGEPVRLTIGSAADVRGNVTRIAPAAQNGTVSVDVALSGLPGGARPDQNVDGTIVLGRVARALSLERPAGSSESGSATIYRLTPDGSRADRTRVELGAGSADRARIIRGLAAGDRVIVSDTTAFDAPSLRIVP